MNTGSEQVVTFDYQSQRGKLRPVWTYRAARRNALKRKRKSNQHAPRKP